MAGDWIPIRKDLERCREVSLMVEQTQFSVNEVVGQLVRFWCWLDGETADGWLPGATEKTLEIASAICPQLVRIMSAVHWVEVRQDGIQVINFDNWFGQNSKRRLLDAKRKRAQRAQMQQIDVSAKRPRLVRKMSQAARTTGEDRRGEDIGRYVRAETSVQAGEEPTNFSSDSTPSAEADRIRELVAELEEAYEGVDVRASIQRLFERCRKKGQPPPSKRSVVGWLDNEKPDPMLKVFKGAI